jgi:8-oxo-dGTP pyrophosphatase MutT (NUDIX family)
MIHDPPDVEPQLAASILLAREEPFEVLLVRRNTGVAFAGGALVFPGGKSLAGDRDPAWADHTLGWANHEPLQRQIRIAGVREVFEETGLLLAHRPDGRSLGATETAAELRRSVEIGTTSFLDVIRTLGAKIDLDALTVLARWITPPGGSKRFDTWFLLARAPHEQVPTVDGSEAVDLAWMSPAETWPRGASGSLPMWQPTWMNLKRIAGAASVAAAMAEAKLRVLVPTIMRLETRPDGQYWVMPLEAGYGSYEEPVDVRLIPR